jgi:hypothetical protein
VCCVVSTPVEKRPDTTETRHRRQHPSSLTVSGARRVPPAVGAGCRVVRRWRGFGLVMTTHRHRPARPVFSRRRPTTATVHPTRHRHARPDPTSIRPDIGTHGLTRQSGSTTFGPERADPTIAVPLAAMSASPDVSTRPTRHCLAPPCCDPISAVTRGVDAMSGACGRAATDPTLPARRRCCLIVDRWRQAGRRIGCRQHCLSIAAPSGPPFHLVGGV